MVIAVRHDYELIASWVADRARVLDLGCGDGALLAYLAQSKQARGYGIEITPENVLACVRNRVDVVQMNLEDGLSSIEDDAFDHVILSLTLQAMKKTELVVREMLRVGREAIVSFPNFGHWRCRLQVLFGHMPVSKNLPFQWYDTPNVHLCTLSDFEAFCARVGARVLARHVLANEREVDLLPNLFGDTAVYRLVRG